MLLTVVATALAVAMILAAGVAGRTLADRARARTAADAAALAALGGGRPAAAETASANGATVVGYERDLRATGATVTLTVRIGAATATARATDDFSTSGGGPTIGDP
ncbi:hypothetical protein [Ilumatobacter sp.]|uniref:hypothetical protein n=1 Tax=Ilumatobacter sp. TaxID=1967498 RepID=UPI003B5255BE